MRTINEGQATIQASEGEKISRELDVFYNPVMRTNRDLSVLLLLARGKTKLRLCDPLAGSGIRTLRFLRELPAPMVEQALVNDCKQGFEDVFHKNAELSKTGTENVLVTRKEANKLLLESKAFDYLDIDPFGSPNEFLDAAVKRTRRGGILAVTATDTAPLCGTYPKACLRKYWAKPRRDHLMHEFGLRILIRKCQLIGAQYDKALIPLLSYSKDHYFRVFFEARPGKAKVDEVLCRHELIDGHGPLWTGQLWDEQTLERMIEEAGKCMQQQVNFLQTLLDEAKTGVTVGFYDVHVLSKELKAAGPPKLEMVIDELKNKGFSAARTHFSPLGIRAGCDEKTIKDAMMKVLG